MKDAAQQRVKGSAGTVVVLVVFAGVFLWNSEAWTTGSTKLPAQRRVVSVRADTLQIRPQEPSSVSLTPRSTMSELTEVRVDPSICYDPDVTGLNSAEERGRLIHQCSKCYEHVLTALEVTEGSDLVLGANNGKSFDPAWDFGYWARTPHHTHVWVEPVPYLFKQLTGNTDTYKRTRVLLNKAVRPVGSDSETLTLFCWDMDWLERYFASDGVDNGGWPVEARQPTATWFAVCSLDRKELIRTGGGIYNDGPMWKALPQEQQAEKSVVMEQRIQKIVVDSLSPNEIITTALAQAGIDRSSKEANFRYLQIDVEGLDNEIIKALPFSESPRFYPELILYENHNGMAVRELLEGHGYYICCCYNHNGNNLVAVRSTNITH